MGRLDVGAAFRYNPLGPVVFLLVCIAWTLAIGRLVTHGGLYLPHWWYRWKMPLLWACLTIFFLVGGVRLVVEMCNRHFP